MGEWKENHLMCESVESCTWCDSRNVARKPSNFSFNAQVSNQNKKVGDLTREFIENSKDDLKNQRKELNKDR